MGMRLGIEIKLIVPLSKGDLGGSGLSNDRSFSVGAIPVPGNFTNDRKLVDNKKYSIGLRIAMAKREKLIEALTNHPNNVTFSDVQSLLELEGFNLDRITGSHHIFKKDNITFVIPVHKNRVKSVYIKRVLELIIE